METQVKQPIHTSFSEFRKFKKLRIRDEEDIAREEEVVELRRQLVPRFRNPFDDIGTQLKAIEHFIKMSSRLIKEVYLTHEVAYGYCAEVANREMAKEKEDDEAARSA